MGPVYLSLPREVLCSTVDGLVLPKVPRQRATATAVPAAVHSETIDTNAKQPNFVLMRISRKVTVPVRA